MLYVLGDMNTESKIRKCDRYLEETYCHNDECYGDCKDLYGPLAQGHCEHINTCHCEWIC